MGRQSKIPLEAAIKSLTVLRDYRRRLVKLRKHLLLASQHIDAILTLLDSLST